MSISGEAVEAAAKAIYFARLNSVPMEWSEEAGRACAERDARLALEAAAPHLMAGDARELEQATRMVATLVLKSGGKVSLSLRDLTDDFTVLTTTPNVITGGLNIEAFQK